MTNAEGNPANAAAVSDPQHVVNDAPPVPSTPWSHSATAMLSRHGRGFGRHFHRGGDGQTTDDREVLQDRRARLWLLAGSMVGTAGLVLAYRLHAGESSPFAAPSGVVAWIALIAGIAGIWLVPGLWMSAVMLRTGVGPVARLATRIGATLAWYVLVGPVIYLLAERALVTVGGIVGATVTATAAACLGVALGLLRRPADPRMRVLMAALVGAMCAQAVIWLAMWFFTEGVNYEQIRRLDWLIVLGCALLAAIGAHSRPDLPVVRTAGQIQAVLITLAVVALTAVALFVTGSIWSPAQQMPSAFGAEQVAAPRGADVALQLTALGPEGREMMQRAIFTGWDDTGRPVPISTSLVGGRSADSVTVLMVVDPVSRSRLCERTVEGSPQGWPVKLTVRDQASGLLVQAVIPTEWCTP
jgi:hypothetical protein